MGGLKQDNETAGTQNLPFREGEKKAPSPLAVRRRSVALRLERGLRRV